MTYTIPVSGSVGSVHLLAIDEPPVIALTSPANNSSYTAPANIVISATASDDDAVQFVDFYQESTLLRGTLRRRFPTRGIPFRRGPMICDTAHTKLRTAASRIGFVPA